MRDAAGCPITRGEYTVTIPGETSRRLDLPMRPVISVSRVLVDGEQTGDWKLLGNALYRESLWSLPNMVPCSVTVTMLAGYDPVPRTSCASCAAWSQPDSSSSRTAAQGDSEIIDALELPEGTKRALRNRFGMRGIAIGVFR